MRRLRKDIPSAPLPQKGETWSRQALQQKTFCNKLVSKMKNTLERLWSTEVVLVYKRNIEVADNVAAGA